MQLSQTSRCKLRAAALSVLAAGSVVHAADPFSIIALPDTQYYSANTHGGTPAMFDAQTQWIVNNAAARNIAFVTHLGDVVDTTNNLTQWDNANHAINILGTAGTPSALPYSISAGNHDVGDGGTNFINYFGPSRYAGNSWFGGASASQLSSWQTFTAGGYNFLHLNVEADASANTPAGAITWAQDVLNSHPGMPTIVTTHNYLGTSARLANGNTIWNGLINTNPQVFMVVNGHTVGEYQQISTNASGGKVIEMLSDYQGDTNGGNGFLRQITFDPNAGQIKVQSYSPVLNQSLTDGKNQFAYDVTFGSNHITVKNLAVPSLPPASPPKLEGWWKLDETTGTALADSSDGWSPKGISPVPAPVRNNGLLVNKSSGKAVLVPGAGPDGSSALQLTNTASGQGYVQLTGGSTGNPASNLGEQTFTLSAWIKRTGTGVTAGSGSGGVSAVPIFAKGVGQSDGSNVDVNFLFGIDGNDHLAADFETYNTTVPTNPSGAGNSGTNFPITGTRPLSVDSAWHHVAVTWDGRYWTLYVDGAFDATKDWTSSFTSPIPPIFPRFDSIQMAAIGTTLNSTGAVSGGFYGFIDDVRIYDGALSASDIHSLALVPEPAGLALLGLTGVIALKRRRRHV